MKKLGLIGGLTAGILVAGCTTTPKVTGTAGPFIPNQSIQLTADTAISLTQIANATIIGAAIHFFYDPLAPNWEIEETKLSEDTYHYALKMKRYHTGGAGESMQIVRRRAGQLLLEQGFASYQLTAFSEGIDSQTMGARRVAEGTIKLVQRNQADSFLLNERH